MKDHIRHMRRCIELAKKARRHKDAPVGSVVVIGGGIVAEGVESVKAFNDPSAHAEILAVREACRSRHTTNLGGAVLYTTVEPCWMCSYVIRQARIDAVVVGIRNRQVGGASSPYPVLTDPEAGNMPPPPTITWDILKSECTALFE